MGEQHSRKKGWQVFFPRGRDVLESLRLNTMVRSLGVLIPGRKEAQCEAVTEMVRDHML